MMNRFLRLSMVSVLTLGISGIGVAKEGKGSLQEHAIQYRQGAFHVIAWNFGAMAEMVKGKIPFDAKAFAEKATKVEMLSHFPLEGFMIEGSDKGKTEAKAALWKEIDKFKEKMGKFEEESAKLVEVSKSATKVEDVKAQFEATGKTCKGCHEKYKEDD